MRPKFDLLVSNAEELLEQAVAMGPDSDITVLQLAGGGYYIITGNDHDLAATQAEHGARAAWQVRSRASSILVSGRSGDRSCQLERQRSKGFPGLMAGVLRDAPSYLLA